MVCGVAPATLIGGGVGLWMWKPWKPGSSEPAAIVPSADKFVAEVTALPTEQQVQRVLAKLKALNPGFDGQAAPRIEDGRVFKLKFSSMAVTNLSPLRALTGLKRLDCRGNKDAPSVADLSPLRGLQLEALDCGESQVSDLAPLAQSPLRWLNCKTTRVKDIPPLRDAPLEELHCNAALAAPHDDLFRAIPTLKIVNAQRYSQP